jgi:hypothetical protein
LVAIAAHLVWPPKTTREGVSITQTQVAEYAYVASVNTEVSHNQIVDGPRKLLNETSLVSNREKMQ